MVTPIIINEETPPFDRGLAIIFTKRGHAQQEELTERDTDEAGRAGI